ncbi:MAG: DUF58 domain-containing protein [Lachnospiraceae bacterium]|jgi:uncharacterized protein (DUF58 family)|nr:DUF58 domain-containing protein [Lachnospiraceae bacterium]
MKLRRLLLCLLFLLSLIPISIFGGVISYALFFAVLLIPLILWAYLLYVLYYFTVYQEAATRNIVVGEAINYRFILANEGRIAFTGVSVMLHADFSYVADVPDNRHFAIFPGERISFDTMLTCKYRGEYPVGVKRLIVTDFLGIFRVSYRMPSQIEAIVKPRIIHYDRLEEIPETVVFSQSVRLQETNEPDQTVRTYIPGDSLSRIHWKSTAKTGELKIRNEIGTIKQKVLILADFTRVSDDINIFLPQENRILERIIALLYYFTRQSVPAEFLFANKGPENRRVNDIQHFRFLYEELATMRFREDNSFTLLFRRIKESGIFSQVMLIMMITTNMDQELYSSLVKLSLAGKVIVVYVMSDDDISEFVRQSNERLIIIADEGNE